MKNFFKRFSGSISFANLFIAFDGELLMVPSMVLSTVVMLCTVTFVPWAVPMVSNFITTYGRGDIVLSAREPVAVAA